MGATGLVLGDNIVNTPKFVGNIPLSGLQANPLAIDDSFGSRLPKILDLVAGMGLHVDNVPQLHYPFIAKLKLLTGCPFSQANGAMFLLDLEVDGGGTLFGHGSQSLNAYLISTSVSIYTITAYGSTVKVTFDLSDIIIGTPSSTYKIKVELEDDLMGRSNLVVPDNATMTSTCNNLSMSTAPSIDHTNVMAWSPGELVAGWTDSDIFTMDVSTAITITFVGFLPLITTTTLPNGVHGTPYPNSQIVVAGGVASLTYSNPGGGMPPGLSINPLSGIIHGTPTTAGTYPFNIRVTDSASPNNIDTKPLSIVIA